MRTETIIRQTENNPESINELNKLYSCWGWNVLSVQITDNKIVYDGDSYTTGSTTVCADEYGATGYSSSTTVTERITEHTNYATITYQRDLDDPRVVQCAELQKQYDEIGKHSWMDFVDKDKAEIDKLYQKMQEKWKWPEERTDNDSYIYNGLFMLIITLLIAAVINSMGTYHYIRFIWVWIICFGIAEAINIPRIKKKVDAWKEREPEVLREKQEFEAEQTAAKEEFEALKYAGTKAFIAKRLEIVNEAKAILGIN